MKLGIVSLCLWGLAGCVSPRIPPGRSVVLPNASVEDAVRHCSRPGPADVEGTWVPSEKDVAQIEEDLPKLARLKSDLCCLGGMRISDPGSYFRQYIGVIIRGQRMIYINAFEEPREHLKDASWLQYRVDVCDGGSGFWGAVYDLKHRRFSELAVNGIA